MLRPLPWLQHGKQFGLEGARRVLRRILPRGQRRQAHQHALDPGPCLETKQGPPVVYQVELDISSPAGQLKPALPLTIGGAPAPFDNGSIGRLENAAHISHELQQTLEAEPAFSRPKVVEENSADASPFIVPVRVYEIVIAPELEP